MVDHGRPTNRWAANVDPRQLCIPGDSHGVVLPLVRRRRKEIFSPDAPTSAAIIKVAAAPSLNSATPNKKALTETGKGFSTRSQLKTSFGCVVVESRPA